MLLNAILLHCGVFAFLRRGAECQPKAAAPKEAAPKVAAPKTPDTRAPVRVGPERHNRDIFNLNEK